MPGIALTLSGGKNEKLTKKCVLLATQITCDILKKNSFETMVIVKHVDNDDWFIDGKSLNEWGKNSFRLEVTVVDETCSKDQKVAVNFRTSGCVTIDVSHSVSSLTFCGQRPGSVAALSGLAY
ncbi:tautomerase family protein [Franconibacter daqui]|uniref:tautomerase family protein n=1 Tax=Franconibacter daqui TaxID=2047724 RepID=UPI002DBA8EEA|nr:hypothetical protein [Franconibacter daqui]MEB5921707.1 hypothetical protein [Franconibacter daqui]